MREFEMLVKIVIKKDGKMKKKTHNLITKTRRVQLHMNRTKTYL